MSYVCALMDKWWISVKACVIQSTTTFTLCTTCSLWSIFPQRSCWSESRITVSWLMINWLTCKVWTSRGKKISSSCLDICATQLLNYSHCIYSGGEVDKKIPESLHQVKGRHQSASNCMVFFIYCLIYLEHYNYKEGICIFKIRHRTITTLSQRGNEKVK